MTKSDKDQQHATELVVERGLDDRSIAIVPARDGGAVQIDLAALVYGCTTVIMERPRDGSPPMVAINADVLLAVAEFARTLSRGITDAKSPGEVMRWREFAADGPAVGGDGAADAWGSVVHPIHVSAVRSRARASGE